MYRRLSFIHQSGKGRPARANQGGKLTAIKQTLISGGIAKSSLSGADDQLFSSEVSLALYLLPALFAGIGVNIISHLLISHLEKAEELFDREHH